MAGLVVLGWTDPRQQDGELAFPERFPAGAVARDKIAMGPAATASQFQQTPSPRAGNIIERDWWRLWPPEEGDSSYGHIINPDRFPPAASSLGRWIPLTGRRRRTLLTP